MDSRQNEPNDALHGSGQPNKDRGKGDQPSDVGTTPAEKRVPDDAAIGEDDRVEQDEVLTPDSDPKDVFDGGDDVAVEDGDDTTGAPYTGGADEQATEYRRSI